MKRELPLAPLDQMIDIVGRLAPDDQRYETAIPFLSLLRSSRPTAVTRGVLKPSCCVILQGGKRVHLGADVLDYGPGEYLVVSVDLPASGQVLNATPGQPYLLLNIEFDPQEIAAIVAEARIAMDDGDIDAGTAAYKVGYESQSQFSREYRRLFGAPPMQDVKKLRRA